MLRRATAARNAYTEPHNEPLTLRHAARLATQTGAAGDRDMTNNRHRPKTWSAWIAVPSARRFRCARRNPRSRLAIEPIRVLQRSKNHLETVGFAVA